MKKLSLLIVVASLLMVSAGCSAPANGEDEMSNDVSVSSEVSAAGPAIPVESSREEESSDSSASTPTSNESNAEKPGNENSVAQTVPAIDASKFYDVNEGGGNLSVLCTGVGRYSLSYENSKSLLAYMDFSRLTPTDQTNNMEIDSADPGIVFTAPDFSYELRLDQNTNLVVYEIGGSTRYYYTMPDGFYNNAYEWATTYAQYNYNEYDDEAFNITTGQNPDTEEN